MTLKSILKRSLVVGAAIALTTFSAISAYADEINKNLLNKSYIY